MTRSEMVKWLQDEITMSGSIQLKLAQQEYDRIIERELRGIYQIDPMAVRKEFTIIPLQVFYTPEFRKSRTIKFPKCVLSIGKFVEMKHRSWLGFNDPAFGADRLFGMPFTTWGVIGGIVELDSVMWRTIGMSTWDQLKTFTLVDIQHHWDEVTHTLLVNGHDPRNTTGVYCEVFVTNPEEELFDDYYVRKWISAHAKLQIVKQLSTFTTNLLNGVTVNTSAYQEEANKDIEEAKAYFNTMTQADQFFLTTP